MGTYSLRVVLRVRCGELPPEVRVERDGEELDEEASLGDRDVLEVDLLGGVVHEVLAGDGHPLGDRGEAALGNDATSRRGGRDGGKGEEEGRGRENGELEISRHSSCALASGGREG